MSETEKIFNILSKVEELPSLPQVVNHILQVMDDPRSNVRDIAEAMESDPALTAKVLRISNSAYYAPRNEITSVNYAITRMGQNEIRNLVITTGVVSAMGDSKNAHLDYNKYWEHCLTVGIAARIVNDFADATPKFSRKFDNPYFVAGLLHDVGILLLDQNVPSIYIKALDHAKENGEPIHVAEKRLLDVDHQTIGNFLCQKWHLPDVVTHTAHYHHQPEKAPEEYSIFLHVVHAADIFCTQLGFGEFAESVAIDISPEVYELLGLKDTMVDSIKQEIQEAAKQSETLRLILAGN